MSIQDTISSKVSAQFSNNEWFELINESHMHSVPANSETHFKLTLVSEQFESMRKVARHQAMYQLLDHELNNGVHALALHLYTPEEWVERANASPDSPNCLGGSSSNNN
ncbi:MAG: BolA/IbaG family iron-sulfur metabolism protein [Pseudomonadota bacterium]